MYGIMELYISLIIAFEKGGSLVVTLFAGECTQFSPLFSTLKLVIYIVNNKKLIIQVDLTEHKLP